MSNDIYSYIDENFNINVVGYIFKRDYIKDPLKITTYINGCEKPYKEDLEYLYKTCGLRLDELCKLFNITKCKARQFIKLFNLTKTHQEANKCSNHMREDKVDRLMRTKLITDVVGKNYKLSSKQRERLQLIVENYSKYELQDREYARSVAYMILYDLTNYFGRIRRLMKLKEKNMSPISLYAHVIRYGKENGIRIYNERKQCRIDSLPSNMVYWMNKGYTEKEAREQIRISNYEKGLIAGKKLKGTSEYTVRSWKYWVKKGYSEKEAKEKARQICVFNLEKCVKKYGEKEGLKRWQDRQNKWLKTLKNKSDEEKKKINFTKGHNIESIMARGYTEEEANKISINYYSRRKNYSNISQECFRQLEECYNLDLFYKTKNHEYQFGNYCVDCYDESRQVVIEFNGDYWHARKGVYDNVNIYGKTSEEIRINDENRLNKILTMNNVKKIIIVWESDYRKNSRYIIDQIYKELNKNDENRIVEIIFDK